MRWPGTFAEHPAEDSEPENCKSKSERDLADHIDSIPKGTVRHLRPVLVPHRFRERAARANPAAIRAFSPAKNNERNEDKCLHKRNGEPEPHRMGREDV